MIKILILLCLFFLSSCNREEGTKSEITSTDARTSYKVEDFTLVNLDKDKLPYIRFLSGKPKTNILTDNNGIPLFLKDKKRSYHPVQLAQYGLSLLFEYNLSANNELINKAHKIADKLLDISLSVEDTLLFPYVFDFQLLWNFRNNESSLVLEHGTRPDPKFFYSSQ